MKILMIGEGAQAMTYMEALRALPEIEVVGVVGGMEEDAQRFAGQWGIPEVCGDLAAGLQLPGVAAVFDTSPSQCHPAHAADIIAAGKHLLLEIPMALTLADSERVARLAEDSGLTCMVAHTRRFTPGFTEVARRIAAGELIPSLIAFHTYFFRRRNLNRFGQPRTWVDDLLWHHACHQVDAIRWFLGDDGNFAVDAFFGQRHPELDAVMDLTLSLRHRQSGCLANGDMSFNHHGPIDVEMRIVGAQTTLRLLPRQRKLVDFAGVELVSYEAIDPFVAQCRAFFAAIESGNTCGVGFVEALPSMQLLHDLEQAALRHGG